MFGVHYWQPTSILEKVIFGCANKLTAGVDYYLEPFKMDRYADRERTQKLSVVDLERETPGTSPVRSHREDFGKMIRRLVPERGFALALIGSAAIHAALLPVLLSFASGSAPRHIQPIGECCIEAFLVPGTLAAVGETEAMPGRKRREADRDRGNPVAVAPLREVPERVSSVEKRATSCLRTRPPR